MKDQKFFTYKNDAKRGFFFKAQVKKTGKILMSEKLDKVPMNESLRRPEFHEVPAKMTMKEAEDAAKQLLKWFNATAQREDDHRALYFIEHVKGDK